MTDELRLYGRCSGKTAEYIKYEGLVLLVLVDKHRNFYFMEMNTHSGGTSYHRQVIDYDLIREQILVAALISGKTYLPQLHAIECSY
jgi:biotin carboxylase